MRTSQSEVVSSQNNDERYKQLISELEKTKELLNGEHAESNVHAKMGHLYFSLGDLLHKMEKLDDSEPAFADAIKSFKAVPDYKNIISNYLNLGRSRRLRARLELQKVNGDYLKNVKIEFGKALQIYRTAQSELDAFPETSKKKIGDIVSTCVANTYLEFATFLFEYNTSAVVYRDGSIGDMVENRTIDEHFQISAYHAAREAVVLFESLNKSSKATNAYLLLGKYHSYCCIRFMELVKEGKTDNNAIPLERYASLAERYWQRGLRFFRVDSNPEVYLDQLRRRAILFTELSQFLQLDTMLEDALSCRLEGRYASSLTIKKEYLSEYIGELRFQLLLMCKKKRTEVLLKLYRMSLELEDLSTLHDMHKIWTSTDQESPEG